MKLSEVVAGQTFNGSLLIRSAQIRQTKAGKPYLQMELYDGTESISANLWDYNKSRAPERNTILDIVASVGDYQGTKQLTILAVSTNTTLQIDQFAPHGDIDIEEYLITFEFLMNLITNQQLHKIVLAIFSEFRVRWSTIPAARSIHHGYIGGTLKHSVDVALKAKALAELTPGCSVELCLAGGLLHDLGKLWTYELDGACIEFTEEGQLLDHIAIGITKLESYRNCLNTKIVTILQHIVASHHGQLEWGSPVAPSCIEAWFIHLADMADAKAATIQELHKKTPKEAKFTEKCYVLGNRPVLTQHYINNIMKEGGELDREATEGAKESS